jgi:hypothetical protein
MKPLVSTRCSFAIGLLASLLAASCGDAAADNTTRGQCFCSRPVPQLVAPGNVVFEYRPAGDASVETIELENRGEATLRITHVELFDEDDLFALAYNEVVADAAGDENHVIVETFEKVDLEIIYRGGVHGKPTRDSALVIESNDPTWSTLVVELHAPLRTPD